MDTHIRISTKALILRDNAILLVEYDDESGLHYNMPGGGVEPDETLEETLKREVQEETCAEVEIGRPLIITEYEPKRNAFWGGTRHSLTVIFECKLTGDTEPQMPQNPDPNQTAVKWIPLVDLEKVELLPHITQITFGPTRTNRKTTTQSISANPSTPTKCRNTFDALGKLKNGLDYGKI